MSDLDVVKAMADAWGKWEREGTLPFTSDCCINGTKVVTHALRRFGVDAHPVSVRFVLFNRFAWDLFRNGVAVDEWPEHAHSIGVAPGADTLPGRWNGHLVAEGNGWALDISASQFARPGRIIVDGPRVMPELPAKDVLLTTDEHNQVLWMTRWPDNVGWKQAAGWRRIQDTEVEELVRRTTALVDR